MAAIRILSESTNSVDPQPSWEFSGLVADGTSRNDTWMILHTALLMHESFKGRQGTECNFQQPYLIQP